MNDERTTGELLEELIVWTRFLAREPLERSLKAILRDPRHQVAYELTDGQRTQAEVGKGSNLDQTTVSDLWRTWRHAGVVRMVGRRAQHLSALTDLGWDVPTPGTKKV
jgi:hypothetical protein